MAAPLRNPEAEDGERLVEPFPAAFSRTRILVVEAAREILAVGAPALVDALRRDRALKTGCWMSVQIFGMAAFRAAVAQGIALAARAAQYVADSPVLELMTPASLGIACFRVNPGGALGETALHQINRKVLARVFWEERAFMSSTSLRKTFVLRPCVINPTTTWEDVRETLETIESFGRDAL